MGRLVVSCELRRGTSGKRLKFVVEGDIIDAGQRTYDHAGLPHCGVRGIAPPDVGGWAQAAR